MRRVLGCSLIIISIAGCASLKQVIQPTEKIEPVAASISLPSYAGPQACIAVGDFNVQAAKATLEIGAALREMLIAALVKSKRFSLVEHQPLRALVKDEGLVAFAPAQPGGGAGSKAKAADLLISVAVTEFEPEASGGTGGVGGGGGIGSGMLGGLLGASLNKVRMALDIRLVNISTSEIIASQRVQGEASDITGSMMGGLSGSWDLPGILYAYTNTPMEKVIRICILEAVRYIAQLIPGNYYRY